MADYLKYYSRKDVQGKILELAKDREVASKFNEGFGKRPDVIMFTGDVLELAKKGATSFHVSEERWQEPLELKPGMSKKQLDENRIGWDLILDIDTPYWDYAKLTTYFLIEALKFHDIENISVKFSGGKGFHIGIPFEAFPDEVKTKNGTEKTKDLFPESLRVVASYLQEMIREKLTAKILEKTNINDLVKFTGKKKEELLKNGNFDPFSIIDIDTILISNRHLFRSAYSLHEKTGLASLPIDKDSVLKFEKKYASPEIIKTDKSFLSRIVKKNEGGRLIQDAYFWYSRMEQNKLQQKILELKKKNPYNKKGEEITLFELEKSIINSDSSSFSYELPKNAIKEENFPYCITKLLEGKMEDGKKRALFILCNFLRKMGWSWDDIEKRIHEWNKKNKEPLKEVYIKGQLSWYRHRKEDILPPNCSNSSYYRDLRVCCGSKVCERYKNPVNYAIKNLKKT